MIDATLYPEDYTLLVGPNNAGKSTIINALRVFYEEAKWSPDDWPRNGAAKDDEAWIEIKFKLNQIEQQGLPEKYHSSDHSLRVRKYLKSDRVRNNQSNIYAFLPDGYLESNLFFGAKNIGQAKLGTAIYIPALSLPADQFKTSGPSPFRTILSTLMKRMVQDSAAYTLLQSAFDCLNKETQSHGLRELLEPINSAISDWGIRLELDLRSLSVDDLIKNLIQHTFSDTSLAGGAMPIDRFGHGFQRAVIYELLRLAPLVDNRRFQQKKKEFDPDFTLILFEEPEAFLHPDQQLNMSISLRKLASQAGYQVISTTHSPIFVGKSARSISGIVRVSKDKGISKVNQVSRQEVAALFGEGRRLANILQSYIDDAKVNEEKKREARKLLEGMPTDEIAEAEERFRFQLWIDGDRASLFFASRVVICEGPSERALFNYLLENEWSDLRTQRISVIDALGKFNIHRILALVDAFSIPHAVFMDGDEGKKHHKTINELIEAGPSKWQVCPAFKFPSDLEDFLGLPKPAGHRTERKPLMILRAASSGEISQEKINLLRKHFERICRSHPVSHENESS